MKNIRIIFIPNVDTNPNILTGVISFDIYQEDGKFEELGCMRVEISPGLTSYLKMPGSSGLPGCFGKESGSDSVRPIHRAVDAMMKGYLAGLSRSRVMIWADS